MNKKIIRQIKTFLVIAVIACSSTCFYGCFAKTDLEKIAKNKSEYAFDISYDDTEHEMFVDQTTRYVNNTGKVLDNLKMHLYANAFREDAEYKPVSKINESKAYPNGFDEGSITIKEILVNNKATTYTIEGEDENILNINFKVSLQPTALHEIYIKYVVNIANVNHRLGYGESTVNIANFYPIACVYESDKFMCDVYSSNGDPFYSDIATYTANITYPKEYKIACVGESSTKSKNEKKITSTRIAAVRDFAFMLSNKFEVKSETVDSTKVNYYYYDDERSDDSLNTSVNALKTFNKLFGKYPYSTLDVCESNFVYGGMEYPCLVYISDNLVDYETYTNTIVHEISHQWWYGVVGDDEFNNGWLDEGLAEYSTLLFYENNSKYNIDYKEMVKNSLTNYNIFLRVYKEVFSKVDTNMNRSLTEFSTEPEYVYTSYVKAMLLQDNLRNILGTKTYLKCLKNFYSTCAFTNATPKDMINIYSVTSKKNLSSVFNSWINGEVVFSQSQ